MIVRLIRRRSKHERALVDSWRRDQRGNGVRRRADVARRHRRGALLLLLQKAAGVVKLVSRPVIVLANLVLLLVTMQHSLVSPSLHYLVI